MDNIKIQLPNDFFKEETRCGYTISAQMKEVWAVLFDLLQEFSDVCKRHNIKWFADGGTILGAVRHKGMIPWDDDIDVMMLREDYDKFIEVAADDFKHPYFLQTEERDRGCIRGHAQLRNSLTTGILNEEINLNLPFNQGVFLDIFPIDGLASFDNLESDVEAIQSGKAQCRNIRSLHYNPRQILTKHPRLSMMRLRTYISKCLFCGKGNLGYEREYKQLEQLMRQCKGQDTEFVFKYCIATPKTIKRRIWRREWLKEQVFVPFEHMLIPIPNGYEQILDVFYGNWREFVIGTATHGGCFLDTKRPYTDYITKA
jgi:lipopolysaccharide cholinephosphotransferase